MDEFSIIKKYFATQQYKRNDVRCGIGDDAAIVSVPSNSELVITTDTLVSGIHFLPETSAYDIGYKSLAVNLSDLAAMGATPTWVTLAITLPQADQNWIKEFCAGFFTLAQVYNVQLIGGDLTHGPLSITVQALGFLPENQSLLRSTAEEDDLIFVTGTLGDAGLALQHLQKKIVIPQQFVDAILSRLNQPKPQVAVGKKILYLAHAAIDISDGLVADLRHILKESKVGAEINVNALPLSAELLSSLSLDHAIELALTAGDDYELCFTLPKNKKLELDNIFSSIKCTYTCIGVITKNTDLKLHYQNGKPYQGRTHGYQHF